MSVQLKRVSEQVIVITGASSGIGLVTAKMAAKRRSSGSPSGPSRNSGVSTRG
jgi:hypothetical protein